MKSFRIGTHTIAPGERKVVNLSAARLYDFTEMNIPVFVHHGRNPGPVLFVSGAIHGDEINGVEIIRRLLRLKVLSSIQGTLIAIPIVNVYGYNSRSRYLPDRRDLNRCFPGTANGSLGSRLAHIFMEEIVSKATHGIDLHTGAIHRKNLPQIRAYLDHPENKKLAPLFGAPVVLNSELRDGSLRQAAQDLGFPILLYEGGEALRFDEQSIQIGVKGIRRVMRAIGSLPPSATPSKEKHTSGYIAKNSYWIRAPQSGTLIQKKKLGSWIQKGDILGYITDPFGKHMVNIEAQHSGLIIGATTLPLINRGDAVFHHALFEDIDHAIESVELFNEDLIDSFRTPY